MQMGYDFENSLLAAEAGAGLRARFADSPTALPPEAPGMPGSGDPLEASPAPELPVLRQPDWAGLRARFAAIHALRNALAETAVPAAVTGSFAAAGESVFSACRNATPVNPVYWGNIKGPCAITGSVAAPPHAATED